MTNALWPYWYPSTKFIFFSAILFPSGTRVMCCWEGIAQWTVWQATCHLYKVKVLTKYANWFHQATNNTDFKLLPWLFNSGCRVVKQEAELAETTDVLQSFLQSAEKKSRCSSAFTLPSHWCVVKKIDAGCNTHFFSSSHVPFYWISRTCNCK